MPCPSKYRFQNILCQSQTFCATPKDDLHSVNLFSVLAQKYLKRHYMGLNFWTGTKHFGTSRRTRHTKTFLEKSNYLLNMSAIVVNLSTTCGLSKQTTSTKSHCTATRGSATLCSTFWKGKFLILVCMISDYPPEVAQCYVVMFKPCPLLEVFLSNAF